MDSSPAGCCRQLPEVSDFVARFCTLRESENTRTCENCTQNAKKCDTNHIPRATAYGAETLCLPLAILRGTEPIRGLKRIRVSYSLNPEP